MCYVKVAELINIQVKEKIINFILKSASRFKSIRDFNSVAQKTESHKEEVQSPKHVSAIPVSEANVLKSPTALKKTITIDFNQIIKSKLREKRDILQEIIYDYPETKKAISLGLEDIPTPIRSSFNSTAPGIGLKKLMMSCDK